MSAFATFALLLAAAPPPLPAEPRLEVREAQFLAIDTRNEPPAIVPSRRIPYRPETSCFAWLLEVAPQQARVTLREELRLPQASPNWGTAEGTTVHQDRAGATSRIEADLSEGIVANEWCVSEGDPVGAHSIRIYQGDRLLRTFEFEVVPDPEDRTAI
jgi:hypothetical protein